MKKDFVYTGDEIRQGRTRYGTPVYDGTFACIDKNKYIRVKECCDGTNLVRSNGRTYKVKGRNHISSSIDY